MRKIQGLIEYNKLRFKSLKISEIIKKISIIRELILIFLLSIGYIIQNKYGLIYIDYEKKEIMDILEFSVVVITLYGIYIAFLQFLVENNKNYYLGVSRIKFLVDKSIWTYFIRSKIFYIMLLFIVIIPVVIKTNKKCIKIYDILLDNCMGVYIYQESIFLILLLYIFLLHNTFVSIFKLIEYGDSTNSNQDINEKILKEISKKFNNRLVRVYCFKKDYKDISNELEKYINNMRCEEIEEFVSKIFRKKSSYFISYFETKKNSKQFEYFYKFFEDYCKEKWEYLKKYRTHISYTTWSELVEEDITVVSNIANKDEQLISLDDDRNEVFNIYKSEFDILKYLNDVLLLKLEDIETFGIEREDESIIDTILAEYPVNNSGYKENTRKYINKYLEYRLIKIFNLYEEGNQNIKLPNFRQNYSHNERRKNYSEICFRKLLGVSVNDISQNIATRDLILSMNNVYQLAFMLYQIIYQDYEQFDTNIKFYDENIRGIITTCNNRFSEIEKDEMFEEVKNIILKTSVKYRITNEVLDDLWKERSSEISDFSWFDKFKGSRMSNFKVIYVQNLLSGESNNIKNRFNNRRKEETKLEYCDRIGGENSIINFCQEYFKLTDLNPFIFSEKEYHNTTQGTVEYLLYNGVCDLSELLINSSITMLLRLEKILRRYKNKKNYTSKTFFGDVGNGEEYLYYSIGIREFYILKIIDDSYKDVYSLSFKRELKNCIESTLYSKDIDLTEYVNSIIEKLNGLPEFMRISKQEKFKLLSKLNDLILAPETVKKRKQISKQRYTCRS